MYAASCRNESLPASLLQRQLTRLASWKVPPHTTWLRQPRHHARDAISQEHLSVRTC